MREPRYAYALSPDDEDGFTHFFSCHYWELTDEAFAAVLEWCEAQFGERSFEGRWMSSARGSAVWFKYEKDAFAFRIRWC